MYDEFERFAHLIIEKGERSYAYGERLHRLFIILIWPALTMEQIGSNYFYWLKARDSILHFIGRQIVKKHKRDIYTFNEVRIGVQQNDKELKVH